MSQSSLSSWRTQGRPEAKGIYFGIAVIVVFSLSLLLVACGTNSSSNPVSTAASPTQPTPTDTATTTPASHSSATATPISTSMTTAVPPTATSTAPPAPAPNPAGPPAPAPNPAGPPAPVVDNYDTNFDTSRNPDLTLEVFETFSTDQKTMHLFNTGTKQIPWLITSIDPQNSWLSVDHLNGTAKPGDNTITLIAANSNLPVGQQPDGKINFKPKNTSPDPIHFIVHKLPTFSSFSAPISGGAKIRMIAGDNGGTGGLDMIVNVSFGSIQVSPDNSSYPPTLTVPQADKPGDVPIAITVQRHDGSTTSFNLPDKFTYTSTTTAAPQLSPTDTATTTATTQPAPTPTATQSSPTSTPTQPPPTPTPTPIPEPTQAPTPTPIPEPTQTPASG